MPDLPPYAARPSQKRGKARRYKIGGVRREFCFTLDKCKREFCRSQSETRT